MAVSGGALRASGDQETRGLLLGAPPSQRRTEIRLDLPRVDLGQAGPDSVIQPLSHAGRDMRPPVRPEDVVEAKRIRFSEWSRRYVLRLAATDAVIGGVLSAALAAYSNTLSGRGLGTVAVLALVGATLWTAAIGMARGYQRGRVGFGSDELRSVLQAGVGLVFVGAFPAGLLQQTALLKLVVVGTPAAVFLSLVARYVARKALHHRQATGQHMRHVIVVGNSAAARELKQRLDREPHGGMKVVGVCTPHHEGRVATDLGMPVLGDLGDVADVVRRYGCDAVAVTSDDATRHTYLRELSWSLEGTGVEMLVDPGLIEVAGPRMHIRPLLGFPLLHVEEPHFTGWRRLLKRSADVALTGIGLLLALPLLVAIAAAIKLQDGGPIFFKQTRVGQSGKPFTMYKFRSMVIDAEARKSALMAMNEGKGGLFKVTRDPRITRLGHFLRDYSLDELPQLWNVLNGTMSLVGPRPHLESELAQMPSHAARRSLVTPGLTGLWQVSGRSDLEGDDAVRLDLRYVENWSLTMDLMILWKTGFAVLAKRGAR